MDLLYKSAFAIAEDILAGKVSSREVLEFFLERVEQHNPKLNAVIALDIKRARLRAEAADAAVAKGENWGPLHGVPMTIKDALSTEGLVTVPNGEPARQGIDHIGFTVENEAESSRLLESNGAKKIATIELGSAAHYEVKYKGPDGIVVDIGHWIGTAPIGEKKPVGDVGKAFQESETPR